MLLTCCPRNNIDLDFLTGAGGVGGYAIPNQFNQKDARSSVLILISLSSFTIIVQQSLPLVACIVSGDTGDILFSVLTGT